MTGKSCAKGASRRTTQSRKKPKGFIAARPCISLTKWKWILVWITMQLWRNACPRTTSRVLPVLIQKQINGSRNTLWIVLCGHSVVGDSPSSQVSTMSTVYESGMPEEELRNISSVSLIEDVDETALAGCSEEQSATQSSTESDADTENTEDDSDEEEIQMLRREHANSIEGSTRQRQIKELLAKLESDRKVQKRFFRTM